MVIDWLDGVVVSADETENATMINDMLANPPYDNVVIE
jgi:hypothetical protein